MRIVRTIAFAFGTLIVCLLLVLPASPQVQGRCVNNQVPGPDGKLRPAPCDSSPPPTTTRRRDAEPIWLPDPDPRFTDGNTQFERGKRFYLSESWELAVAAFEEAVKNVPEDANYRAWLARARDQLSAWRLAERERLQRIRAEEIANRQAPTILKRTTVESAEDVIKSPELPEDAESILKPAKLNITTPTRTPAHAARVRQLRQQIRNDQLGIKRLGFARTNADLMAWTEMAQDSKNAFETKLRQTITEEAIAKSREEIFERFRKFDPAKAARVIRWLKSQSVVKVPDWLIKAVSRVGRAKNKNDVIDDAKDIVDAVEKLGEEAEQAPMTNEEKLDFLVELLEGLSNDPRTALLVTELRVVSLALYNNATHRIARREVERLTQLNEQQLKALNAIDRRLKKNVAELRKLEASGG